ncbi:MAG TPA: hypothetical protein VGG10_15115 [Rhizomicrobium sp.]|jgi:hypothetical protein
MRKGNLSDKKVGRIAATGWEPLQDDPETGRALDNDALSRRFGPQRMALRLAHALLLKSKPELVAMIESMWDNEAAIEEMLDMLEGAAQLFGAWRDMVATAHARALVASAVHIAKESAPLQKQRKAA